MNGPRRLISSVFLNALIGKVEMDESVDASHFLAGTEENLVGLVKGHEQELAGGKQDGDGDHPDQAVDRGGMVDDDLPCDGKKQNLIHGLRGMEIEHAHHLDPDGQIKAGGQQIVIVRIFVKIRQIAEGQDQPDSHDQDTGCQEQCDDVLQKIGQTL